MAFDASIIRYEWTLLCVRWSWPPCSGHYAPGVVSTLMCPMYVSEKKKQGQVHFIFIGINDTYHLYIKDNDEDTRQSFILIFLICKHVMFTPPRIKNRNS